jgi:hypothetical protein
MEPERRQAEYSPNRSSLFALLPSIPPATLAPGQDKGLASGQVAQELGAALAMPTNK